MYNRNHPYLAHIKERALLTKPGSSKQTWHVVLDASIPFHVGDSVAIMVQNDPSDVEQIMEHIGSSSLELAQFLQSKANLGRVTASFLKTYAPQLYSDKVNEFLHAHHLLDILKLDPSIVIHETDLMRSLLPLMPRFYSIANSPKVFENEIHLTVAYVLYTAHGRIRRGVGSHFLCHLAEIEKTQTPIYIQPSHGFTLPADPEASIIFVGPGTGIAPFRAFMQERLATQAPGRNWLFFGERNRATDFLYETYWLDLQKEERLRLNLAFSRDTSEKIYVQHQMYEERKSLWNWLENGAYFYVCGDAEKMAKDVEAMLRKIACEEGGMSLEESRLWMKKMRSEKRYLADVY